MKMAIKKTEIDKVDVFEVEALFHAHAVSEIEYGPSELASILNEVVFEFDSKHEEQFVDYLRQQFITGRILY
jgi:hypothetical protein